MQTITERHRRFAQNRRGVSNVIVVALSLVIIVAIVSNVFLWSYQMNQFDWERTKENIKILEAMSITNSSWFTAQSEYTIDSGSRISGTYIDTKSINALSESFSEAQTSLLETLLPNSAGQYSQWPSEFPPGSAHWTLCDEAIADDDNTYVENNAASAKREVYNLQDMVGSGAVNWVRVYVRARLVSTGTANIRILLRTYNNDYESANLGLTTYYQNLFTQYNTNPNTGAAWTWTEINSLQAGASSQRTGTSNVRLTAVWVILSYSTANSQRLAMYGSFSVDTSTYPLADIQTIEILLRYQTSDVGEKLRIKAYNWTSLTYTDFGFNNTAGHTPTLGWDSYALNITNQWHSYVANDGTMYVKLQDDQPDSTQTTINIDFFGVRTKINGTLFSLRNEGSLTTNIVSVWIINSTIHKRYDADVFVNSAETLTYIRCDIRLPDGLHTIKMVTQRGNMAVYLGA